MKGCLDLGDKAFLIAISQHLLVQEFSSMAEISFFIFIESKSVSLSLSPPLSPTFSSVPAFTAKEIFLCQVKFTEFGDVQDTAVFVGLVLVAEPYSLSPHCVKPWSVVIDS